MDYISEEATSALVNGSIDEASNNLRNLRAVAALGVMVKNLAEGH